jgi:hypothetical protein
MFRRLLETEILIDASPARIWAVLADFAAYPQWNPYVTAIEGDLAHGARLALSLVPPGRAALALRPRVTECAPESLLTWKGHYGFGGLLASEHSFEMERRGARTHLWHAERFSGLAVPFLAAGFYRAVEHGFKAMNLALKQRAERPAALRAAG